VAEPAATTPPDWRAPAATAGEPAANTPPAWRAAAATVLAGGAWLGYRATTGRRTRLTVMAAVSAGLGGSMPIAIASRRPPIPPRDASTLPSTDATPTFTVVVGARDEAPVIGALVRDLGRQDHRGPGGQPGFELIVIDDRSVDDTAGAARRAAEVAGIAGVTRVVRRDGPDLADGKGAALTAVPPEAYAGDVAVVLDADARVGPRFLSTLAHYVTAGAPAVTARRRILDAGSSWLAGAQADEQTVDGELQRGRWSRGGLSEFRGNGITVRRDLLIQVGGWRAAALTEDLDLSSRVAAATGAPVAWAIDAEVWEEPVRTWRGLWRQRLRWAEGAIRRAFEHGPSVLRSPAVSVPAKLDFIAYIGQLAAPPLLAGAAAGALTRGRPAIAAALVAVYASVAGGLAWDALRWDLPGGGGPAATLARARRAVRAALFGTVWLAAVPAALWRMASRRGPVTYDKMEHAGGHVEGEDERFASLGAPPASGARAARAPVTPAPVAAR
jgi:hypothetical protein